MPKTYNVVLTFLWEKMSSLRTFTNLFPINSDCRKNRSDVKNKIPYSHWISTKNIFPVFIVDVCMSSGEETRNFISIVLAINFRFLSWVHFFSCDAFNIFLLENNNCNWNVCCIELLSATGEWEVRAECEWVDIFASRWCWWMILVDFILIDALERTNWIGKLLRISSLKKHIAYLVEILSILN